MLANSSNQFRSSSILVEQRHRRSTMTAGKSIGLSLLSLLLLALSGCGEKRIEVFPVTGKVTFDGHPPVGALIVLHAAQPLEVSDIAPTGRVKEDGSFSITVYQDGDGAPPGEYVATVQWYKIDPKLGGPGPNVIPKHYSSKASSPIKVTVQSGPTTLEPITISSKGTASGTKPGTTSRR